MSERTTINIKNDIRKAIQEAKVYRRDTYDDVLGRFFKEQLDKVKRRQIHNGK